MDIFPVNKAVLLHFSRTTSFYPYLSTFYGTSSQLGLSNGSQGMVDLSCKRFQVGGKTEKEGLKKGLQPF
jgi:hypothetical protein